MSTVLSFHIFSAFYEEFKKVLIKKHNTEMNISFEPMLKGEMKMVSLQFSFFKGNFIYLFHTETLLGDSATSEEEEKKGLRRATVLFNIIRTWLDEQKVVIVPARYGQRVNGLIDYQQFFDAVDKVTKDSEATSGDVEPIREAVKSEAEKESFQPDSHS